MSNNYNRKKIYQNKLIITKDINKKNKIKQEIINKNRNDSFLIFDENGNIYNKEKENLQNIILRNMKNIILFKRDKSLSFLFF